MSGRLDEPLDRDDLRRLLLQAYLQAQKAQEGQGTLPVEQGPLGRFGGFMAMFGAIQFGLFLSSIILLLIFLLTRILFHIDMERYFPF